MTVKRNHTAARSAAGAPHIRAALLQGDKLAYNLLNASSLQDLFNRFPWYGHNLKLVCKTTKLIWNHSTFNRLASCFMKMANIMVKAIILEPP